MMNYALSDVTDKTPEQVEKMCLEAGIGEERYYEDTGRPMNGIFVTIEFERFMEEHGWQYLTGGFNGKGWQHPEKDTVIRYKEPVDMVVGFSYTNNQSVEETVEQFKEWDDGFIYDD